MKTFLYKKLILVFILLYSANLFAIATLNFSKLIQEEQYQEAIDYLNSTSDTTLAIGKKNYLLGVCLARLKKYDEAIVFFSKAINLEDLSPDLHYEYGQALYANNNLESARYEFTISAGKNFNYIQSIYYAAYISELLNDLTMAKSYYWKLIKDKRTDKKFLQISLFQYTKILIKMLKREGETFKTLNRNQITANIELSQNISRYVLPLLKKAQAVDPSSQLNTEIEQLTKQIEQEFNLDQNTLINRRRLSPEHFYLSLSQRLKYNTNVENTNYSSAANESELFTKYDFILKRRFVISPELRANYLKYKNKENPVILQYNSLEFSSALRNKLEHTYKNKAASLLVDFEYSTLSSDWSAENKIKYNSKKYGWGVGEQLSFFNCGETFLKFKQTSFHDQSEISNYKKTDFSIDQYIFLRDGQQLLITSFNLSKLSFKDNNYFNTNQYLFRFIHLMFDFIPSYTLQTIISTSLTDTIAQKKTRGYEINFNPSIDLSKAITDHFRLSINFSYTHNFSKQLSYKFNQQVVETELNYTF